MKFNYKKFTKELYEEYKESLTFEEVNKLLDLNEEYNKDTPISTGKRILIDNVSIFGEKEKSPNQDYSEAQIDFSLSFNSGVNILIADNLKGKSSVFKIIKYALTGSNSLKQNIKKWIHYAFVNFSINEKKYTAYLDLSEKSLSAYLLYGVTSSTDGFEANSKEIIFEANSETSYQDQMSGFFFNQFAYYSLKWTQKSSQKDSDKLLEAGASWKTYFKSILLESKDSSNLMYGNQGKKVFQMLLGIELTYPINRLSIRKDMLNYEKAQEQIFSDRQRKQNEVNMLKLQTRFNEIELEIKNIRKESSRKINLSPIYKEYNTTIEFINSENRRAQKLTTERQSINRELNTIKNKQDNIQNERYRLKKELVKLIKQNNDLKEYIEIGVLFSNLDIKQCPSCNHDVTASQKNERLQIHKCSLCGDNIKDDVSEIDTEVYDEKILNLEIAIRNTENEITKLDIENKILEKSYRTSYEKSVSLGQKSDSVKDVSALSSRLLELEEIINNNKTAMVPEVNNKEKLIAEMAVLKFRIKEIATKKTKAVTDYEAKIQLLSSAIVKLSEKRFSTGARVLDRLSKLMTDEIQALGLSSITEINIDDNFEIQYKQDNDFIKFENIAEGEQLRAKIAFYLSLILLDIEFNFGRHTRLLIIDSPGKEEADSKYLEGFAQILNSIEKRYSNKLQILIGTAERQLSGVIENQKEIPKGEYVF